MEPILDRILSYYGLSKEDYATLRQKPSFSSIPTLHGLKNVSNCVKRIHKAKEAGEKVLVYGDYDTDGVMATSIMVRLLRELGIDTYYYIPSRYSDGYGLNLENAQKISTKGYGLVILVDNGITLVEPILSLTKAGIDVMIIDHHEMEDILPLTPYIIHPKVCEYGKYAVSAGYLSFIFSLEFKEMDPYLLCLGALSILSDMMPLKGHNRDIVILMLDILRKQLFDEFALLLKPGARIDEKLLTMSLIPQINAIGRLDKEHKILLLVSYFADIGNREKKEGIATWMKEVNETRKRLTSDASERLQINENEPAIIVTGDLPEGLNGLLANRLLVQYKRPVAVFSTSSADPSIYVGSVRSLEGFDFMEAKAYLSDYLHTSGGHAHAGGMSVKKDLYPAFRKAFLEFAAAHPCIDVTPERIPLLLEEANMDTYQIIEDLSPFGHDYEEPEFELSRFPISALKYTFKAGNLSTPIGGNAKLFSFAINKGSFDARCDYADFGVKMSLSTFRGVTSLDLYCTILRQYK